MATNLEAGFQEAVPRHGSRRPSFSVAYVGVVNGLFSAFCGSAAATSRRSRQPLGWTRGYVRRPVRCGVRVRLPRGRWRVFSLSETGTAMLPDAPNTLMPSALSVVLNAHMAERAAGLMRTGERPGEKVLAERETILPWFGAMLEASFARFFEETICASVPVFSEIDAKGGLVVDLGCGNGWYLRALARRCGAVRGLGLDGFEENISQATRLAEQEGLDDGFASRTATRTPSRSTSPPILLP